MLGVNYESSDDEDVLPAPPAKANPPTVAAPAPTSTPTPAPTPELPPPSQTTRPPSDPVDGPAQGPAASPPPPENDVADGAPPGSPYTSNRAIIQNLTLPTVPNFAIPPSPPGSPPQRATKKFAQFLELKKKGQHFNQRLESSSVLRDPGHSQKLMDFAGVGEEEQYASTLPDDLAVPTVFPPWAYVEELRASQKKLLKAKEQERSKNPREAIDFVSATKSSTVQNTGKRKEFEHRSRDVSPKRRR